MTSNDIIRDGSATMPLLVTIPEAARMLAIGRSTLYELIAARQLTTIHIGRATRITVEEIQAFIARRTDEPRYSVGVLTPTGVGRDRGDHGDRGSRPA
jgi:excisionase family DNA binding protein